MNEKFDSVLKDSLTAIPPPDRLNQKISIARLAFFLSLSGGSPEPSATEKIVGDFLKVEKPIDSGGRKQIMVDLVPIFKMLFTKR